MHNECPAAHGTAAPTGSVWNERFQVWVSPGMTDEEVARVLGLPWEGEQWADRNRLPANDG